MGGVRYNVTERFWSKVEVRDPDGCWEWQACRERDGYGMFYVVDNMQRAHRVAWALTNGPIPEGMCVLHKCDNPACCNPAHLFLGTRTDNVADRVRKGRSSKGERVRQAKLTEADVIEIRIRYRAGSITQESLGLEFGVSRENVGVIVRGETWKHLLGEEHG